MLAVKCYQKLKMIKKLHLYIIKEFFGSFVFGLSVFSIILFLDRIFDLIDLFLSKGVVFSQILKLFIFFIPNILVFAIPMSVLFGVLLSYGRLSEDNEIIVIKSSGLNYKTLSMPIIVLICIISFFLIFFNHFLFPSLNSDFKNLYEKILTQRPLIKINEKMMVEIGEYRLYADKINKINNTLLGVSIYKFNNYNAVDNDKTKNNHDDSMFQYDNNSSWCITASSAMIKTYKNGVKIVLHDGYLQNASPLNIKNMIYVTFKSYCFFIPLENIYKESHLIIRGMSSPNILKAIKRCKEQNISFSEYEKEYWLRWIFATAPISFVIIALPIGIMAGKGGKAIGFGVSLAIILVYYIFLVLALTLNERIYVPISIIIWVPNFIIITIGIYLFAKMIKR